MVFREDKRQAWGKAQIQQCYKHKTSLKGSSLEFIKCFLYSSFLFPYVYVWSHSSYIKTVRWTYSIYIFLFSTPLQFYYLKYLGLWKHFSSLFTSVYVLVLLIYLDAKMFFRIWSALYKFNACVFALVCVALSGFSTQVWITCNYEKMINDMKVKDSYFAWAKGIYARTHSIPCPCMGNASSHASAALFCADREHRVPGFDSYIFKKMARSQTFSYES